MIITTQPTGMVHRAVATILALGLVGTMAGGAIAQEPDQPLELGELELLWESGGPAPEVPGTMSMAIHPITGDVWVAVAYEDRFWILSPDGAYKETWGEPGSGPGQFRFGDPSQLDPWAPGAIAFAPDGSFYVGDLGNFRIQQFDAERDFIREWGSFGKGDGQFSQLLSVATDGVTVFAGDCDRWDVQAFDEDGVFLRSFGGAMASCDLALDGRGIVHANNVENELGAPDSIMAIDAEGGELYRWALDGAVPGAVPWSHAVAADGTGFVTMIRFLDDRDDYAGILEVDPSGAAMRGWEGGGDRMLVSPEGDAIYVARGIGLPKEERWSYIRKYALPAD